MSRVKLPLGKLRVSHEYLTALGRESTMKLYITSNFFVPGLEHADSVEIDHPGMTLREFLEELSKRAPTPIEYVRPGAETLDPDDWEVAINGIPYQLCADGLRTVLKDGDTVRISLLAFGGG